MCGHIRRPAVLLGSLVVVWFLTLLVSTSAAAPQESGSRATSKGHSDALFLTSHDCAACHNGLTTPAGEDVSIGLSWRASMMANSARDPYWQAGVRREIVDHPQAAKAIEDECALCHMPMARTKAHAEGREGEIFRHLPIRASRDQEDRLAADGVSCTVCHQIGSERLGERASFNGGFVLGEPAAGGRRMLGPFQVDAGRQALMRSATGMTPTEATYLRESEICATCHTLFTKALGPTGEVIGELPEQVPYLEWRHSAFRQERSCQSCHMPQVAQPMRIASVLGEERVGLGRHTFIGGNFFMLRMLNRYRDDLGVEALPQELEAAAAATIGQLQRDTAALTLVQAESGTGRLSLDVFVRNLTGHKLPTAYPSRRAWLHLTVRDSGGRLVFESGAIESSGRIRGNDNDDDPARLEPHHREITAADQVQIYESIMRDSSGSVTTGLLRGVAYIKDNRLLPRGFDKLTAAADVAVVGEAFEDQDFAGGEDHVRYTVNVTDQPGPFRVDVELRYQPISFRWADNLRRYDAPETNRFTQWYSAMSGGSSEVLARTELTIR